MACSICKYPVIPGEVMRRHGIFSIPNEMVHYQLGMYSQDDICSILKIDNAYLFAKIYLRKIVWLPRPSFGLLLHQYEYYPQIIAGYVFLNVNS